MGEVIKGAAYPLITITISVGVCYNRGTPLGGAQT